MNTLQDVRVGVRLLAKRRAFTGLAMGTLAVGIGTSTAPIGVLSAPVMRPLPYADSDRIVQIVTRRRPQPHVAGAVALRRFTWNAKVCEREANEVRARGRSPRALYSLASAVCW